MKNLKKVIAIIICLATLFSITLTACGKKEVNYTAEFTWKGIKATATLTPDDGGEKITLDATVEKTTEAATCETSGKTVYTATVEKDGKKYTDKKEFTIDAIGHEYGEWQPAGNGTHKKVCKNDQNHVITGDCEYITTFTKQPTETETGHAKNVCSVCGDVDGETDLPVLSDAGYKITNGENYKEYSITIDGHAYSFKVMSIVMHASEATHIKTNFDIGTSSYTQSGRGNGKHVRFAKDNAIEYAIIADGETENVTLSLDCFKSTLEINNLSVFDMFDVTLNNTALTASEAQQKVTFEKWGDTALIKIATVTLQKGLNYVRLTAKGDYVRAEFLEVAYSGNAKVELAKTTSFNAVDAQVVNFVSTNGEEKAGVNGVTTGASYLGKFSKGSNVRLNTTDYIEYTFECDKDVTIYLGGDYSERKVEEITNYDLMKLFIKDGDGEYAEIGAGGKNANVQSLNFTKAYGAFQTIYFGTLELKAGKTYTLKLQARRNLHIEYVDFCYLGECSVELTVKE